MSGHTHEALAAGEQNKSAVTDHAISLNHGIDWDQAKVIDREGNKMEDVYSDVLFISFHVYSILLFL